MAKENTHAKFALEVLEDLDDTSTLKNILQHNRLAYLYGSVFPDTFYYGSNEKIKQISENLHNGKTESNLIVKELIPFCKYDEKTTAFLAGYLTHYALDLAIHPKINKVCSQDDYCHTAIETNIDREYSKGWNHFQLKNLLFLNDTIPKPLLGLELLKAAEASDSYIRQHIYYIFFRSRFVYILYRFFKKKSPYLGLFYGSSESRTIDYKNSIGRAKEASKTLFKGLEEYLNAKMAKEAFIAMVPPLILNGFEKREHNENICEL